MSHTHSPVGNSAVPSDGENGKQPEREKGIKGEGENGDGAPPAQSEIRDPDFEMDFVDSRSLRSPKWAALEAALAERPEGEKGRTGEGEYGNGAPPAQLITVDSLGAAGVYECWRVAKLLEAQDEIERDRLTDKIDAAIENDAPDEEYHRIGEEMDKIDARRPLWKRLTQLSDDLDPRQRAANLGVLLTLVERLARYEFAHFHPAPVVNAENAENAEENRNSANSASSALNRTFLWDPLPQICNCLGISHSKLSQFCREVTGMNAHELLDRIRAETVKAQMRAGLRSFVTAFTAEHAEGAEKENGNGAVSRQDAKTAQNETNMSTIAVPPCATGSSRAARANLASASTMSTNAITGSGLPDRDGLLAESPPPAGATRLFACRDAASTPAGAAREGSRGTRSTSDSAAHASDPAAQTAVPDLASFASLRETNELPYRIWNALKQSRRAPDFDRATYAIAFGFKNYQRFYRACLLYYGKTPGQLEIQAIRELLYDKLSACPAPSFVAQASCLPATSFVAQASCLPVPAGAGEKGSEAASGTNVESSATHQAASHVQDFTRSTGLRAGGETGRDAGPTTTETRRHGETKK